MSFPVPVIPDSAPFTAEQRAWLNGYLAGLMARGAVDPLAARLTPTAAPAPTLKSLTVLFGSQTGTSEGLAKRAVKEAGKRGFAATVMDMAGFTAAQLAQEKNVLVIVSTYGDGEPPDSAKALHTELSTLTTQLAALNFAVCALGDTNYTQFCKCGADFDNYLGKLGATRVGIYVHSNKAFRPPANGDTPMIMVGPGTGIAPFRAFLADRHASGAKGRNWLFFGDQRAATDFLYREELATLIRDGVLTRLDTAFSRDQAEKIYVQQRMVENASELYAWLEQGAHFYVCGDASRMAKDVDVALHQVIERAGGKTPEQAAAYVQALKAAKRYARDVY